MKKLAFLMTVVLLTLSLPQVIYSKKIFVYHRLALKDLEQMDRLMREKIRRSHETETMQVVHLVEATLSLFSRPNFDNLIEKLTPVLVTELNNYELKKKVFEQFIDESLIAIKDEQKDVSSDAQVTYLIALENWMIEFKNSLDQPEIYSLFEKIANSGARISKLAKNSAEMHMPYPVVEPVDLARKELDRFNEKKNKAGKVNK